MPVFKPGKKSLSEQLDRLAQMASMMSPSENSELDLEAQVSRKSLQSGSSFSTRSTQIPLYANYGAAGSLEQVSFSSIKPLHSAFSPRPEGSCTPDFASVHSSVNEEPSRPMSSQSPFESLVPLLVAPRVSMLGSAAGLLRSVWYRTHRPARRSLTIFHKCLSVIAIGVIGSVAYIVATGRGQELWLVVVYVLCWAQGQLGFSGLPICDGT